MRSRGRAGITKAAVAAGVALLASSLQTAPALPWTSGGTEEEAAAAPVDRTPVEVAEMRTRTTRTFRQGSSYRTEVSSASLHYRDATDAWVPIDTTVTASSGGGWESTRNAVTVRLPRTLADRVELASGADRLGFVLRGATGTATAESNAVTYHSALPGADVRYDVLPDSLKETVVLAGPTSPNVFVFDIGTSAGLIPVLRGNRVDIVDAAGSTVFGIAPPFMDDAAGVHSDAVALSLTGSVLTMTADPAWLASPLRKWPVAIDPNVTYGPATDCSIHSATPTTADCTGNTFKVGFNGLTTKHRALLSFPEVSKAIPESANVLDAALFVTQTQNTTGIGIDAFAYGATKSWTTSATWNTYNGTTAWSTAGGDWATTPEAKTPGIGWANHTWEFWPVELVQGWVDGSIANNGLILKTDEVLANELTFASSEAGTSGNRPTLWIDWADRLGLRDSHKYDRHRIDDRTTVNVNLANGNAVVEALDLHVRGTGLDQTFRRYSNTQYDWGEDLGHNWTASVGPDVEVDDIADRGVQFTAPSNFTVLFKPKAGGGYTTPPGLDATLTKDTDGTGTYTLQYNQSKEKLVFARFGGASDFSLWKNIDRNNNTITYGYDNQGEWDTITDTQGRVTTINHNGQGNISSIVDSTGRTVSYAYDTTTNRLTSVTNADNKTTTYEYDVNANLSRITTPEGRKTKFSYTNDRVTALTRVTDTVNDTGPTTTYTWDVNRLSANQGSIEIDTAGWTAGTASSIARSTAQAADGVASLAATSGGTTMEVRTTNIPAAAGTSYSATVSARAATAGDPVSAVLRWINSSGGVISTTAGTAVTDTTTGWTTVTATGVAPAGAVNVSLGVLFTSLATGAVHYVDKAGIVVGRFPTWNAGWTQALPAGCNGLWTNRMTDPRGNSTVNCRDKSDRVTVTMDPLGHLRSTSYNSNDNVTTFTGDTVSAVHTFNYDSSNNLMSIVAPQSASGQTGTTTSFHYPGTGLTFQPDSRTDPQGNCQAYSYDTVGNVTNVYDGLTPNISGNCAGQTGTVHFEQTYNSNGTLATQQAPGGNCNATPKVRCTVYTYTYAPTSPGPPVLQRIVITNPSPLGSETVDFDTLGRVTKVTDGRGKVTRLSYDAIDRLTQLLYDNTTTCSSSVTCTTYTYDADGNTTQRVDNTGTTTFTFDLVSRLTKKATPVTTAHCSGQGGLTFGWDAADNMTSQCDAGGTTTYSYDGANRLNSLAEPGGSCSGTVTKCTTFGYDNDDRRTSTTYPTNPAVVMAAEYLPDGHVKKIEATRTVSGVTTVLSRHTYTYAVGTKDTLLRRSDTDGVSGQVLAYTYDTSNRLTRAQAVSGGASDHQYGYDANGNRTSLQVNGGTVTTYGFNQANQLTSGAPTTPTFDGAGNETRGPDNRTATYNAKNQTASITPPGGSALNFTYADADSTERTAAGSTSYADTPLGIALSRSGTSNTYYTRDADGTLVSQRLPSGSTYYYVYDGLGSVVNLVDTSGNVQGTYSYDPFGGTTASGTAAAGNPFRFASGFLDSTGLYKFGTRYYDAAYGRWTQRDAIAGAVMKPGTVNRYIYAGCDPVNNVDPSGYEWWDPTDWDWELIGEIAGYAYSCLEWGSAGATVGTFYPVLGTTAGFIGGCLFGLTLEAVT